MFYQKSIYNFNASLMIFFFFYKANKREKQQKQERGFLIHPTALTNH